MSTGGVTCEELVPQLGGANENDVHASEQDYITMETKNIVKNTNLA